jgi:sulfide:quinone oxidoreductase
MSATVLIAGGGVAALEAALALRDLAGERAEVEICSPREDFVYRPFSVAAPYGATQALRHDMSALAERCGARFRRASIGSVDPASRRARTHDGEEVSYDELLVACGTRLLAGVPGALTFWGVPDDPRVRELIDDLRAGKLRRVAFTMPAGGSWVLPLYELALLAEREVRRAGVEEASLVVVTPEESPLLLFGRRASERVGELLAGRGIELLSSSSPVSYADGRLSVAPGDAVEADAVLSLPRLTGRQIGGVPHDLDGFVPIDEHCRVGGMTHAYAAGDVTSVPVKQGGLAGQQADVAAEAIAAELGVDLDPRAFEPVMRGVLWTGEEPLYLEGHPAGGHGESSVASAEPLWQGDEHGKLVGRYLTPFFAGLAAETGTRRQ